VNTRPIARHHMTPFQHRPLRPPSGQFVSGLIPLQSVSTSIANRNWIQPTTAASAKLPAGWLIAVGGAYAAYHLTRSREGLAIGVAVAMLAGEAVYEILDGISQQPAAVAAPAAASTLPTS